MLSETLDVIISHAPIFLKNCHFLIPSKHSAGKIKRSDSNLTYNVAHYNEYCTKKKNKK